MRETNVALGVGAAELDHAVGQAARIAPGAQTSAWHVLWTRSNCEELVLEQLIGRGFHMFLPTIERGLKAREGRQRRRVPLFRGHIFLLPAPALWCHVAVADA